MATHYRWLILSALIISALALYAVGSMAGFSVFLLLGAVFEIAFWVKLIGPKN
jgi:hypothetical protein